MNQTVPEQLSLSAFLTAAPSEMAPSETVGTPPEELATAAAGEEPASTGTVASDKGVAERVPHMWRANESTDASAGPTLAERFADRELAPMMQQYLNYKTDYPEHLILMQVGDFYEIFFDDAVKASDVLHIRLTSRDRDDPNRIPMAGVPIHALDNYLPKLLAAGCSVVIISQVEGARSQAKGGPKGTVLREISRIITPGVRFEGDGLEETSFNFLGAIVARDDGAGAIALIEVSTGWVRIHECDGREELIETMRRTKPSELLMPSAVQGVRVDRSGGWFRDVWACAQELGTRAVLRPAERVVRAALETRLGAHALQGMDERFGALSLEAFRALQLVLGYADEISFGAPPRIARFTIEDPRRIALIDAATRRNLEILETRIDGNRKHSLLAHLNHTRTAMGSRLLGEWLLNPSADKAEIESRHEAVGELVENGNSLATVRQSLCAVRDMERILSRVTSGRAAPRDLSMLRDSLKELPTVLANLQPMAGPLLVQLRDRTDLLDDVLGKLSDLLTAEPPIRLNEGGICKDGFHPDVDRLRTISTDGSTWLLQLEQRERAASGISGLKVKYNNVFGYFIEISKAHSERAPSHYERRQTLVNAERFVIPELKEFESSVLSSKARLIDLERELFVELRSWVATQADRIQQTADILSQIDVLCAYALCAVEYGYVRPKMVTDAVLRVVGGRHPVVERVIGQENFVRNDITMDGGERRFAVLTGPNMGGKSTYLRQIGLIQLLAQAGSFVPAESAEIGIADRIFTRIGAADDLARGDSTFMVEMRETATILRRATDRSLVLIDEIGRGTATADGLSIATAIAEWLHDKTRCKTVFATHFHELTQLADRHAGAFCLSVGVFEEGDEIVFTHRIEERAANRSYGVEVARLAGLPDEVVRRAAGLLEKMSGQAVAILPSNPSPIAQVTSVAAPAQAGSEADLQARKRIDGITSRIRRFPLNTMSPLQALVELHELQEELASSPERG